MKEEKKNKKKKVSFTKSIKLKLIALSVLGVILAFVPLAAYVIYTFGTDINEIIDGIDVNLLICAGASLLILLLMGYLVVCRAVKPLRELTYIAARASVLDFSENKSDEKLSKRKDEIGFIRKSICNIGEQIDDIMSEIREQQDNVSASSEKLSQELTQFEESIANIAEITAKVSEEREVLIQQMDVAGGYLKNISEAAEVEVKTVNSLQNATTRINDFVIKSGDTLTELIKINEKTVGAVNMIVDQTNSQYKSETNINDIIEVLLNMIGEITLLSLNASAEAARAGASGRDFRIVSEQIRKVAEDATLKAEEIETIIDGLMYHSEDRIAKQESLSAASKLMTDRIERVNKVVCDLKTEFEAVPNITHKLSKQTDVINQAVNSATGTIEQFGEVADRNQKHAEAICVSLVEIMKDINKCKDETEALENVCEELERQTGRPVTG